MKKRSLLLSILFLLLLSTALVGCNGGGTDKTSNNNNEDTPKNETKDPEKAEEVQKELVFGRGGDSVSLDPITTTEGETFKVTVNLFETLINYGEQDTTLHPSLATEWKVSDDALEYTLTLREGVKFHDGTDFNADAVVTNFERWMNGDEEQFPYYTMFGGYKGDEGHVIKEVKAVDAKTVVFTLYRPQAPFLKNLAMSPFGIASPAALEKYGDDFMKNPVGTGPFKFVEWKENDRIVIEKNPDYWMEGYPKLEKVIFRSIPENSARLNALLAGEIDLMDGVNPSDLEQIKGNPDLQMFERPSMNIGYLGFTTNRPPFDNKLVRQALNHAVDKEGIIEAFYGGFAETAKNPLPPALEGYNDDIQEYPYDLKKAKELLTEAGFADGFEMELWAMPVPRPYMPDGMKVAEVIQSSFAEIGVKAEIKTVDWGTYLEKAAKGEFDAYMLGWTGDNGDPDNFIYTLLDKDSIGSNNYSFYSNDELHDILIEAQTIADQEKRNELYKKAQEIIHEDSPWVPLVHSTPFLAGKKNLLNLLPHPTGSDILTKVEFE
ncbi:ABC transporter substrate-binding protein [Fredinandcohnia quinoae]|uniref:ABC transporter substrate-binding protein n=1 Tax=Fredinandcohnia quinoae TaxID=2918902 RepID=A0AAW5E8D6_9BACI|nr:ABC transporter substrate-binding protein [Fredinandcohnia sp. SECRCQ15]MCH1627515.1 ABC transporter substrate-binding protein [Fredinandcohnia sp. SECRCQ15]